MSKDDLERFTNDWAKEAAQHALAGDALRLQQNENYWRRVMLAHVADAGQRMSLSILRRALVQQIMDERGAA